jgi:hypothetical protein
MDKQLLDALLATEPAELAKAINETMGLHGIRHIKDVWSDEQYHGVPTRDEIKTGPAHHASGAGVEHALSEYSNPAAMIPGSLAETYEKFTKTVVENFGTYQSTMKSEIEGLNTSFTTALGAIADKLDQLITAKAEDKKEMKKEEKEEKEDDMKKSSIALLWKSLGDLEEALAKAEDGSGDLTRLADVRTFIENAEHALDETEKAELIEQSLPKAQVAVNLGWQALVKATGLSRYGLEGRGNQKDEAVAWSEDQEKEILKAEAKARIAIDNLDRLRKALGLTKAEEKEEKKEEKKEMKEEYKKSEETAATAAPVVPDQTTDTSNVDALKGELSELTKTNTEIAASMKAINERVTFLNNRIEQVTGHTTPKMVPVMIKSKGISSNELFKSMNDKLFATFESGEMSEDEMLEAKSLLDKYRSANAGHISVQTVNQLCDKASVSVQRFIDSFEPAV